MAKTKPNNLPPNLDDKCYGYGFYRYLRSWVYETPSGGNDARHKCSLRTWPGVIVGARGMSRAENGGGGGGGVLWNTSPHFPRGFAAGEFASLANTTSDAGYHKWCWC